MADAISEATQGLSESAPLTATPPPTATVSLAIAPERHWLLVEYGTLALFLISVLGLFLELLLIRWISTEIRIFAYLQNTVLVVCFLGLGMGCWDSRRAVRPSRLADSAWNPDGSARRADDPGRARKGQHAPRWIPGLPDLGPIASRRGDPLSGSNAGTDLDLHPDGSALGDFRAGRAVAREVDGRAPEHDLGVFGKRGRQPVSGSGCLSLASALYLPPAAWFALFAFVSGILYRERWPGENRRSRDPGWNRRVWGGSGIRTRIPGSPVDTRTRKLPSGISRDLNAGTGHAA